MSIKFFTDNDVVNNSLAKIKQKFADENGQWNPSKISDGNWNFEDIVSQLKNKSALDENDPQKSLYDVALKLTQEQNSSDFDAKTDWQLTKEIDENFDKLLEAAQDNDGYADNESFNNFKNENQDNTSKGQQYRNKYILNDDPIAIGLNNIRNIQNGLESEAGKAISEPLKDIPVLNMLSAPVASSAINLGGDIASSMLLGTGGAALGSVVPGIGTAVGGTIGAVLGPLLKNAGTIAADYTQAATGLDPVTGAKLNDKEKTEKAIDTTFNLIGSSAPGVGKGLTYFAKGIPIMAKEAAKSKIGKSLGKAAIKNVAETAEQLGTTALTTVPEFINNTGGKVASTFTGGAWPTMIPSWLEKIPETIIKKTKPSLFKFNEIDPKKIPLTKKLLNHLYDFGTTFLPRGLKIGGQINDDTTDFSGNEGSQNVINSKSFINDFLRKNQQSNLTNWITLKNAEKFGKEL